MTTLTSLPRRDLIRLVQRLATERNAAKRSAEFYRRQLRPDYSNWTSEQAREHAQAILDEIGPDPDARAHRLILVDEVYKTRQPQPAHLVRPRSGGARCVKGSKVCGKLLDERGLCPRHDARQRRALREQVPA